MSGTLVDTAASGGLSERPHQEGRYLGATKEADCGQLSSLLWGNRWTDDNESERNCRLMITCFTTALERVSSVIQHLNVLWVQWVRLPLTGSKDIFSVPLLASHLSFSHHALTSFWRGEEEVHGSWCPCDFCLVLLLCILFVSVSAEHLPRKFYTTFKSAKSNVFQHLFLVW